MRSDQSGGALETKIAENVYIFKYKFIQKLRLKPFKGCTLSACNNLTLYADNHVIEWVY